ncbi:hypothetical protein QQM79_20850 [Marinobacteraceae bacterium S3BR75-40.1]
MLATFMQAESAKQRASVIERQRMRELLINEFAQNQVDVYVQTEEELTSLWIGRLERRGYSSKEIEKRFEELTGDRLTLAHDTFEIVKAHGATAITAAQDGNRLVGKTGTDLFFSPPQ